MQVVVVDDEAPARRRLIRLLEDLEDVEVLAQASNGAEAIEVIDRCAPDLLLLDIRMPQLDGLALVAKASEHAARQFPAVIFVTAYDEHALEAFDVGAIDYLLKPVRKDRLRKALERAAQHRRAASASFEALNLQQPPRIVVHERGATRLFDATEIARFWASEKYTLFRAEGDEHMTAEPLNALEQRLESFGYQRVHRAELIRLSAIRALKSEHGVHEAELTDGQLARVSRRLLPQLKKKLGL